MPKIPTPVDVYDLLFDDILNPKWKAARSVNEHYTAEKIGRVIEFLERNLVKHDFSGGAYIQDVNDQIAVPELIYDALFFHGLERMAHNCDYHGNDEVAKVIRNLIKDLKTKFRRIPDTSAPEYSPSVADKTGD